MNLFYWEIKYNYVFMNFLERNFVSGSSSSSAFESENIYRQYASTYPSDNLAHIVRNLASFNGNFSRNEKVEVSK